MEYICTPLINRGLIEIMNDDIHQNIEHIFLTLPISKIVNKIPQFQNLQQNIIAHQPLPMELAKLTNLENKIESNLTTPLILIKHL